MQEQRPGSGETMRRMGLGVGLAIGMGVGVALGAALHNMGTGIAIGLVFGAAVMVLFTFAGSRMQREEQRRATEAGGVAAAEPGERGAAGVGDAATGAPHDAPPADDGDPLGSDRDASEEPDQSSGAAPGVAGS